jgi:hypothetical protein
VYGQNKKEGPLAGTRGAFTYLVAYGKSYKSVARLKRSQPPFIGVIMATEKCPTLSWTFSMP